MIAPAAGDARGSAHMCCLGESRGRAAWLDRGSLDTAFHTDIVGLFDIVNGSDATLMLRLPRLAWGRSNTHGFNSVLQVVAGRARSGAPSPRPH